MQKLLTLLATTASLAAAPTLRLASNIAFEGDYRVGESITFPDGHTGNVVFWSTTISLSPAQGAGYLDWFIEDDFAPLVVSGRNDLGFSSFGTWYPADQFQSPLPTGYSDPSAQWTTNYFAFAYVPGQRDNYALVFDTGITPYQTGDAWLDWGPGSVLRVTWASPPFDFGLYPAPKPPKKHGHKLTTHARK